MAEMNEPIGKRPDDLSGVKGGAYAASAPAAVPYPQALLFLDRIRWSAVWAGLVVALATQILLNVLGAAIGLSGFRVSPTTGASQTLASSVGAGTAVWSAIVAIIALFLGGWTAARLSGMVGKGNGTTHGIVVWCVTLILGTVVMALGLTGVLGSVAGVAGQAAASGTVSPGAVSPAEAARSANIAAQYMASASWWFFITSILSMIAATLGGVAGIRKNEHEEVPSSA